MSAFDPDIFLQSAVEGSNDTSYPTLPNGEYFAMIDKIDIPKDRKNKKDEPLYMLEVSWKVMDLDPALQKIFGDRTPTLRQTIFLDLTAENNLDMGKGKNIGLGKLREALNLNSGKFSFTNLVGAGPAKIAVAEEPDAKDRTIMRNRVSSVGKIS